MACTRSLNWVLLGTLKSSNRGLAPLSRGLQESLQAFMATIFEILQTADSCLPPTHETCMLLLGRGRGVQIHSWQR